MSVRLSTSAYQRAIRAEQRRRNPAPPTGAMADVIPFPLPPVRVAPFTGSAGL